MKKIITVILISLGISMVNAQEKVYNIDSVEVSPDFPGGKVAFAEYVSKNLAIPEDEKGAGVIELSFIIEVTGKLSSIKIIKDIGGGHGWEAAKVLAKSPTWIPGKIKGTPVRVSSIFSININ